MSLLGGAVARRQLELAPLAPPTGRKPRVVDSAATAEAAAAAVASAIAEGDDRWELFKPFGLTPVGGPIGAWYAQMVYWGYQARDAWRESLG